MEGFVDLEPVEEEDDAHDSYEEDSDVDDRVYGASTLDIDTGILTYRGGFISPDINKSLITSVICADDVEKIDDSYYDNGELVSVFYGCDSLVTVHINSSCAVIGSRSFYQSSLKSVHMPPGSCIRIHELAFYACLSILSITIPGSCTSIAENVFQYCVSLKTVNFAETHLVQLERGIFDGCAGLNTINLPSLTKIPSRCFWDCISLRTIIVPDTCTQICQGCFRETSITSINIPVACEFIGDWSFGDCLHLMNVKLPDSCVADDSAFDGCVLLEAAALKMNVTIEQLLRYRYRLPRFVIPSFAAFNRCDMQKSRTGSDGIGLNEEKDVMVAMYRRIESADLWRKILGYVRPADV